MRELWKYWKAGLLLVACTLFLGAGMRAEAAAPAQVTGVEQVYSSTGSIGVKWNAVLGNNVQYKSQICADSRFVSGVQDEQSYRNTEERFTGLSSGKKYYVRVAAYTKENDNVQQGAWSAPLEVVTEPGTNKNAKFCQTNAGTTSITLKWNRNPEANAYRIQWHKAGDYSNKQYVDVENVASYKFDKLSKDTEYNFMLYPVNKSATYKAVASLWDDSESGCPTLPGKVSGVKGWYWSPTSDYFELSWNKRPCADGYQYEVWSVNGKGKKLYNATEKYNTSSSYFKNNKLKKAQFPKMRVRPYVALSNGSTKYGTWSNWSYTSRQPALEIRNVRGGQKLTWNKVDGAKNYTIWVSTRQKTGYKKVKTTTKRALTVKKCGKSALKSGRTYYYTIVANKKIGKKTYQGSKTHSFSLTYHNR